MLKIPYQKEKYGLRKTLASSFIQQLSLSVPAAAEDLGPLVEGGGGGGEHDEVFLLQTQSAHSRCGVEAARPREDLPRDGEGEALVLQLPDMRGESGAWLGAVPAISLVLGNPVPHGALREACVGLLLASGGVGDLRPIDYSPKS